MVKKDQFFHMGLLCQFQCGPIIRMSPPPVFIDLLRRKLGVVDQDVCIPAKLGVIVRLSPFPRIFRKFIVRDKDKGLFPFSKTEAKSPLRMVEWDGVNDDTVNIHGPLSHGVQVLDLSCQVLKFDGEIAIAPLGGKDGRETLHAGWAAIDRYLGVGLEDWVEEEKP